MIKLIISSLFLCVVIFGPHECYSEQSILKHVQLLFRHGDRAPITIYPKDINQADKWPSGLEQLTDKGIRQHFELGLWIRRRYMDFLGSHLNYSLVQVRSTDVDRTLMSAESNLAGIFYNYSGDVIKGLKWRPIPIHTVKQSNDILLNGDMCPIYKKLCLDLYHLDYFKKKLKPYEKTLELLQKTTGYTHLTFYDVWRIYDTIYCEKQHNLTIDGWITDPVWQQIQEIDNINWEIMYYGELSKLVGGFLLLRIVNNLKSLSKLQSPSVNNSKLIIYSGHDTDIAPLASLLGFFYNIQPPYTATIFIELHYVPSRQEKWAVKVIYKNYTDSSGTTNILPEIIQGCNSSLCPLSKFIEITKSKVLTEEKFKKICYNKPSIILIIQILFAIIASITILFIIFMIASRTLRKSGSNRYSRILTEGNLN